MTIGPTRRDVLIGGLAGVAFAGRPAMAVTPTYTAPVTTTTGRVRGLRDNGVSAYLGIPYGTDTSKHRFQPARPPAPWTGIKDCVRLGHQSPQMDPSTARDPGMAAAMSSPFVQELLAAMREGLAVGNEGEDCLVLNVYTPHASRGDKRPVMFWMHGGGFTIGSGGEPQYDGSALVRRGDVVVVTVNHRLNALGFLYLGAISDDFADSGNVGMLDLVLALQWVRDNIENFGGDPHNVIPKIRCMPASRQCCKRKGMQRSSCTNRCDPTIRPRTG
jgi:para-nitrobenzyl esterase